MRFIGTGARRHQTGVREVVLFLGLFLFLWGSALLTLKRLGSIMKLDQKSKVKSQTRPKVKSQKEGSGTIVDDGGAAQGAF